MRLLIDGNPVERVAKTVSFQIEGRLELQSDIASIPPTATVIIGNAIDEERFRVIKNSAVALSRGNKSAYVFTTEMTIDSTGDYMLVLRHQGVTVLKKPLTVEQ